MRKFASVLLAATLAVSTFLTTTVGATTGPQGKYTYEYQGGETYEVYIGSISFSEYDEEGNHKWTEDYNWIEHQIFSEGKTDNCVEGVNYDLETNTLTLKNYDGKLMGLSVRGMGDDFTLEIEGECALAQVEFYCGKDYSSSLNIEGTGTLTVNEGRQFGKWSGCAFYLYSGGTETALNVGEKVHLNIYAPKIDSTESDYRGNEGKAVQISRTNTSSAEKAMTFANGQDIKVVKENEKEEHFKYVYGWYCEPLEQGRNSYLGQRAVKASDPDGIYTVDSYAGSVYDPNSTGTKTYQINRYVYLEEYGIYVNDESFGDGNGYVNMTQEEFEASDYTLQYKEEQTDYPEALESGKNVYRISCALYEDTEGNTYGKFSEGTWFSKVEEDINTTVFNYKKINGVEDEYIFTPNTTVNVEDLTVKYDEAGMTEKINGYYIVETTEDISDTLGYKAKRASDPEGIYGIKESIKMNDEGNWETESYEIRKYIYNTEYGIYLYDMTFGTGIFAGEKMTIEEFENSDYSYIYATETVADELEVSQRAVRAYGIPVYTDDEGNEYAVRSAWKYDENTAYEKQIVYDFKELEGLTSNYSDDGKVYIMTENTDVDADTLEQSYDVKVYDDVYNYYIDGTELLYKGEEAGEADNNTEKETDTTDNSNTEKETGTTDNGNTEKETGTTDNSNTGKETGTTDNSNTGRENETTASDTEKETKPIAYVKPETGDNNEEESQAAEEISKLVQDLADNNSVAGIDEKLAEEIKKAISEDKEVKVELQKSEVNVSDISETEKTLIEDTITESEKIAAYFDIELLVKIDNEEKGNVTELGKEITVSVPVPADLPEIEEGLERTYFILRVHEGIVDKLPATVSGDVITFKTDKFSTYVLTYEDNVPSKEGTVVTPPTDSLKEPATDNSESKTDAQKENAGTNHSTTDNVTNNGSADNSSANAPKTGDSMVPIVCLVLTLMASAAVVLGTGKKKTE